MTNFARILTGAAGLAMAFGAAAPAAAQYAPYNQGYNQGGIAGVINQVLGGGRYGAYGQGNVFNHEPTRTRKLLLHRREIRRLIGAVERQGLTLVPLDLYFSHRRVKAKLALVKGKQLHDKREDLKKKDAEREIARALRSR